MAAMSGHGDPRLDAQEGVPEHRDHGISQPSKSDFEAVVWEFSLNYADYVPPPKRDGQAGQGAPGRAGRPSAPPAIFESLARSAFVGAPKLQVPHYYIFRRWMAYKKLDAIPFLLEDLTLLIRYITHPVHKSRWAVGIVRSFPLRRIARAVGVALASSQQAATATRDGAIGGGKSESATDAAMEASREHALATNVRAADRLVLQAMRMLVGRDLAARLMAVGEQLAPDEEPESATQGQGTTVGSSATSTASGAQGSVGVGGDIGQAVAALADMDAPAGNGVLRKGDGPVVFGSDAEVDDDQGEFWAVVAPSRASRRGDLGEVAAGADPSGGGGKPAPAELSDDGISALSAEFVQALEMKKIIRLDDMGPFEQLRDLLLRGIQEAFYPAFLRDLAKSADASPSKQSSAASFAASINRPGPKERVSISDFDVLGVLGSGSYGRVRVWKRKDTAVFYAVKSMRKRLLKYKNSVHCAIRELACAATIRSPFVCSIDYAFETDDEVHMAMRLAWGGDLERLLLAQEKKRFNRETARFFAAQIALGLYHSHENGIIHRDIKASNVLLDERGNCQITDYGLAVFLHSCSKSAPMTDIVCDAPERYPEGTACCMGCRHVELIKAVQKGRAAVDAGPEGPVQDAAVRFHIDCLCPAKPALHLKWYKGRAGTPAYWCREMLARDRRGGRIPYGVSADWWSFGCLVYALMTGRSPFSSGRGLERDNELTYEASVRYDRKYFDDESAQFISALLDPHLSRRLGVGPDGFQQIQQHPFFRGMDWGLVEARLVPPPCPPKYRMRVDLTAVPDKIVGHNAAAQLRKQERDLRDKMAGVKITDDDRRLFAATYHIDPRIRQMEAVHRMHVLAQRADREEMAGGGAPMHDDDSDEEEDAARHAPQPVRKKRNRRQSVDALMQGMTARDVQGIAERPEDAGTRSEALVGMEELEYRGGAAMYFFMSDEEEQRFRIVHMSAPEGFVERLTRNAHLPMWKASPPARARRLLAPPEPEGTAAAAPSSGAFDPTKLRVTDAGPGGGLMSPMSSPGTEGGRQRRSSGARRIVGPVRAMPSPDGAGSLPGVTPIGGGSDGLQRQHWQSPTGPGEGFRTGPRVPGQVEAGSDQGPGAGMGGHGTTAAATIAAAREAVDGGRGGLGPNVPGRPGARPTPPPRGGSGNGSGSLGTRHRDQSGGDSLGTRRAMGGGSGPRGGNQWAGTGGQSSSGEQYRAFPRGLSSSSARSEAGGPSSGAAMMLEAGNYMSHHGRDDSDATGASGATGHQRRMSVFSRHSSGNGSRDGHDDSDSRSQASMHFRAHSRAHSRAETSDGQGVLHVMAAPRTPAGRLAAASGGARMDRSSSGEEGGRRKSTSKRTRRFSNAGGIRSVPKTPGGTLIGSASTGRGAGGRKQMDFSDEAQRQALGGAMSQRSERDAGDVGVGHHGGKRSARGRGGDRTDTGRDPSGGGDFRRGPAAEGDRPRGVMDAPEDSEEEQDGEKQPAGEGRSTTSARSGPGCCTVG